MPGQKLTIEIKEGITLKEAMRLVRASGSHVQDVICSREKFASVADAATWCRDHQFRTDKVDVDEGAYSFRQFGASECVKPADGGTSSTITLTDGVQAVVCQKKAARAAGERAVAGPGSHGQVIHRSSPFEPGQIRYAEFGVDVRRVPDLEAERLLGKRDQAGDGGTRLYEISIASESEIERWFGIEVLGHQAGEVDTARAAIGMSFLVQHNHNDHVGIVEPGTFRIDPEAGRSYGFVRFSGHQRAQDIRAAFEDKTRTQISVGYFIKDWTWEPRQVGVDDKGRPVMVDVYRITRWQPVEVSTVSAAADITVGVGRQAGGSSPAQPGGGAPAREEQTMKKKIIDERGAVLEVSSDDPREAATPEALARAAKPTPGGVAVADAPRGREAEIADIADFCDENGIDKALRSQWIREGLSADQVARKILEVRKTKGSAQPAAEDINAQLPKRDRNRYRFSRAILLGERMRDGDSPDGLEGEYHTEMVRKNLQKPIKGGLLVPMDLRSDEERWEEYDRRFALANGQRTLDSKTLTKGTETVFERPGELIELLRNTAVVARLGARILAGLSGPVAFTKQTGGLTVYWVGENPGVDVTASDVAFGLVNMVPKTLQGTTAYSRQLLVQSSIDIEAMIREEFAIAHALRLDKTAFYGLGVAGEPMGIYQAPDVNVRAVGGAPDAADVIQSSVLVAEDNALLGTLGWATTPGLAGEMLNTPEITGATNGTPLWQGTLLEGILKGYRAMATNQLSKTMTGSSETGGAEHGAVFGNWRDLIIGMFAAMELVVDPYAQKKRGLIEVTSFQMADEILRHGESFCKWTGAT